MWGQQRPGDACWGVGLAKRGQFGQLEHAACAASGAGGSSRGAMARISTGIAVSCLQTLSAAVQSAETSAATVCEMCMNSCNDRTVVMPPCCSICAAAAAPCTHTHRAYNTHHMHARNSQSFALSYTSCSLVCLLLVLNYCGVAVVFFSLSCL